MAFNELGRMHMIHLAQATQALQHRGPDHQNTYLEERIGLGHRRLSVIDPSPLGHQPMTDPSGRYTIVYNGEIYNYQQLRQSLQNQGVEFSSQSDTEVLLHLYITKGAQCLDDLQGCFAFAIFDSQNQELFLARDRLGVNPLLYYYDEDKLAFASEMKSLLAYNIPKELQWDSLLLYLQLNYVPGPQTMLKGVQKLMPGHYLKANKEGITQYRYYQISYDAHNIITDDYATEQNHLTKLLEEAVVKRLVSDVPLGAFLSGGVDSSIVVAIASKHLDELHTFSIGYQDQPFFDETHYAQLVAKQFNTRHSVFSLTQRELIQHLQEVWDHLDEPFGDSSVLPTYILSKYTRNAITVALSGDGADELFGGYHKHLAFHRSLQGGWFNSFTRILAPIAAFFPKSRHSRWANKARQMQRYVKGLDLSLKDRYWFWAGLASFEEASLLLNKPQLSDSLERQATDRAQEFTKHFHNTSTLNDVLYADMQMVLPFDMLSKVDWMSMAHGLEVRVPFTDHHLVDFAFSLPSQHKVQGNLRKKILQDAYRDILPKKLYNRPKKGFEVPLWDWMKTELRGTIDNELLADHFIADQGIFDKDSIIQLKQQLWSKDPGDTPARIWGLLVFQNWWKKYFL